MGLIFITQPHTSWTHRLARLLVRPLVGTPITPYHLTTARLVTGVAACSWSTGRRRTTTSDLCGALNWIKF